MRLLSSTAITEVAWRCSLSPILEVSVDSGLPWGLLGGEAVSSVGVNLSHDGPCPPSEEDLRVPWRPHEGAGRTSCVLLD